MRKACQAEYGVTLPPTFPQLEGEDKAALSFRAKKPWRTARTIFEDQGKVFEDEAVVARKVTKRLVDMSEGYAVQGDTCLNGGAVFTIVRMSQLAQGHEMLRLHGCSESSKRDPLVQRNCLRLEMGHVNHAFGSPALSTTHVELTIVHLRLSVRHSVQTLSMAVDSPFMRVLIWTRM